MSDVPHGGASTAVGRTGPAWVDQRSAVVAALAVSAALFVGAAVVLVTYWVRGPLDVGHSWAWQHRWTGVTSWTAVVAVVCGLVVQALGGAGTPGGAGTRRWWVSRRQLLLAVAAHRRGATVPEQTRCAATTLARRAWVVLPAAGSAVGLCGSALDGAGTGFVRIDTVLVVALIAVSAVVAADAYRGARLLGARPDAVAPTGPVAE